MKKTSLKKAIQKAFEAFDRIQHAPKTHVIAIEEGPRVWTKRVAADRVDEELKKPGRSLVY